MVVTDPRYRAESPQIHGSGFVGERYIKACRFTRAEANHRRCYADVDSRRRSDFDVIRFGFIADIGDTACHRLLIGET